MHPMDECHVKCEKWKTRNAFVEIWNVTQLALKQLASFEPKGKLSKKQQKIGILAIGPPCRNVKMWLTRCFGCSSRQLFLWTRIWRKYAAHIHTWLFLVISNHYRFVRTANAELTIIFSLVFWGKKKTKNRNTFVLNTRNNCLHSWCHSCATPIATHHRSNVLTRWFWYAVTAVNDVSANMKRRYELCCETLASDVCDKLFGGK